jgi:hypothetical protein
MPTFEAHRAGGPNTLTTPISYITAIPPDPFCLLKERRTFSYYAPREGGWILVGAGPNCKFELDMAALAAAYDPTNGAFSRELLAPYTYDPTNGELSAGDLWRTQE